MRHLIVALLALIPLSGAVPTCPAYSPLNSCTNPAIFVMDASSDADYFTRNQQITYVMKSLLPHIAINQPVTFLAYGVGPMSEELSISYNENCATFQNVANQMGIHGGQNQSIESLMTSLANTYSSYRSDQMRIVLFATSNNDSDINAAGLYSLLHMSNWRYTVVLLRNDGIISPAWYNLFPADYVIPVRPGDLYGTPTNGLWACLLAQACNLKNYCDALLAHPTTTTTASVTTTADVTTTTASASNVTESIRTTTAGPSSDSDNGPSCTCNVSSTWVDVMLLFDVSSQTGPVALQQYHTRIGIILYSGFSTLLAPLGTMNNAQFMAINSLPQHNDSATDINGAFDLAFTEFSGPGHRKNARKVIVVLSTGYVSGSYPDPSNNVALFKQSNGYIIAYNLLNGNAPESPALRDMGYYIRSDQDFSGAMLQQGLCNANCFCSSGFVSFTSDDQGTPTAGCYLPMSAPANFQIASKICDTNYGGYVAEAKTAEKTSYLTTLTNSKNLFIGLKWNSDNNDYSWVDGNLLGSFQPWYGSTVHDNGVDCVAVWPSVNSQWLHTDCRNGFLYVCEKPACDSENYCSENF